MQLTILKDPKTLTIFLKNLFESLAFKRHRYFYRVIQDFLKTWFKLVRSTVRIRGYSFFFKGKLGRKGSVRKEIFFFRVGLASFSNKNLRFNTSSCTI